METPRREQFSGCLVGQCLGDALGFLVEGYPPEVCSRHVEEMVRPGWLEQRRRGPFAFGQYSDDSQLARELLQSYVELGRFDPAGYAARIAAIFAEDRIVGRGRATDEAARRLARGVAWDRAGTPPPAAGNGSAMRAGPVGLIFFDDPAQMVRAAHDQGRITHLDPRCSAGAIAIAGAVALALQPRPIDPPAFLSQLAEWTRPIEPSVSAAIEEMEAWMPLPPEEAAVLVATAGLDSDYSDGWQGISPFVTSSILWSLYSFLRTPRDYWQTVGTAIAAGGDVDTTAAMAGAISGAHLGLEAVPAHLAARVNDQGTWGLDDLVELAHSAHGIAIGGN